MNNQTLGKQGEAQAIEHLKSLNLSIIDQNYRHGHGEIDVIAHNKEADTYIFVEVKARSNTTFQQPEESVTDRKLEKVYETAEAWLMENEKTNHNWQIDIISIDLSTQKLTHFKNVS